MLSELKTSPPDQAFVLNSFERIDVNITNLIIEGLISSY